MSPEPRKSWWRQNLSGYKWGSGFRMDWVGEDAVRGDITIVLPLMVGEDSCDREAA